MALQDILKKILSEADATIKLLQDEAAVSRKKADKQAKEKQSKALASLDKKTDLALASIDKKIASMARREKARMILAKKQAIIKDLRGALQTRLEKASDDLYAKIITPLLAKVPDKKGVLQVPKSRLDITKKCLPEGVNFTLETGDLKGGFILKSSTGEIDSSFESLINDEFKASLEIYLAEQLKFV